MGETPSIDPTAIRRLERVGGPALVGRMIELFLLNAPERVGRAVAAAAEDDLEGVERATHSLKSMAANIGALQLYAMAESIELAAATANGAGMRERVRRLANELEIVRSALDDWKEES